MSILQTTIERPSLAAGELSPALRWRRDLARNAAGVKRQENMVTLLEGGATRRPGTRFVIAAKAEAERGATLKFELTVSDSYLLYVNGGAIRFLRAGGYLQAATSAPYEVAVPWTAADVAGLRGAQDGASIYVVCAGYRPRILTRLDALDWSLAEYPTMPVGSQNLDETLTIQASGVTGSVTLTASGQLFTPDDVGTVWRLDEPDLTTPPAWVASETGIAAAGERRYGGNVYRTSAGGDAGPNPPTHTEGTVSAGDGYVDWEYRHRGYGFCTITAVAGATSATATVTSRLPDSVAAGPTYRWFPPAWSDARGWPDRIVIHERRLCFFRDDWFWFSQSADFDGWEVRGADDDAIIGRLRPQDGALAQVEWAASTGALVAGTRGGEWVFATSDGERAISSLNVSPDRQGTEGSGAIEPVLVNDGIVFVGRSRERLHFVRRDALATRATIELAEITLACRHLLQGKAAAIAYQRDPGRVLWIATDAGELVALTFNPAQDQIAAHRHPMTNAFVEDLAVIPSADGTGSDLYLFVRRTIDGATRRYVELLQPFFVATSSPATAEGAWFVDSGLELVGAAASELSGLDHLEGETVAIHADGAWHPPKVVTGGAVALDRPVTTRAVAGIAAPWLIETLPIEVDTPKGSSKGKNKQVKRLAVDVVETGEGKASSLGGTAEDLFGRGAVDYGAHVALATRTVSLPIAATGTEHEVTATLSGDGTMPVTIAGIHPDVDMTVR